MGGKVTNDGSQLELNYLQKKAEDILLGAQKAGASQAEIAASSASGLSVSVRQGALETVERNRDRGFSLSVYFGHRKGSASTSDFSDQAIAATLEQACAMAKFTEEDPASGLADKALMASVPRDFDLWHPYDLDVDSATEMAKRMEAAGRALTGISNSDGASIENLAGMSVYANSHGFMGQSRSTRHSMSCALIAADESGMQNDYWYDTGCDFTQLKSPEYIGEKAGKRVLARLGAKCLSTRKCPVLFAPQVARGLFGHFLAAVSGGALYRQSSFLLDSVGETLFPPFVTLDEQPWLTQGPSSTWFDAEGVATKPQALVKDGVLARYLLGSYSARKLALQSTANAGGVHNLLVSPGDDDFAAMVKRMHTGLLVTDVMGQGVSIVTGDYSRGANGFWVENGKIAYPVEEITIASNLREMFKQMVAVGNDVDRRHRIMTGSVLIEQMTVAGE